MGTQKRGPKFPSRISVQMSDELKTQLNELARREYGGDLQALLRETLQARVDESGSQTDHMHEVLQALDQVGQDIIRQNQDLQVGVQQLLAHTRQLTAAAGVQHTDLEAIAENLPHLERGVANQNDAITKLTEEVASQNDAIAKLIERANERPGKLRSFLNRG